MKKILALVAVLSIAYFGYSRGMDGGEISLLIVVLSVLLFILGRVYKRSGGTRGIAKGMTRRFMRTYDPTLPPVFEDEMDSLPSPYSSQVQITEQVNGGRQYGGEVYSQRAHAQLASPRLPEQSTREAKSQAYQPMGMSQAQAQRETGSAFAPQAPANAFELALGPNAFIDIQQALVNSLFLDPSGQLLCVMIEELADKGVPLLFVDVGGSYSSLIRAFPHGRRICSPTAMREDAPAQKHTLLLDSESTDSNHVGQALLQEGLQLFFDFASYAAPADAIITLWEIIEGMVTWERTQLRRSGRFLPCIIVLTEAHRLCADDDRNSLFHEVPDLARAVRSHIVTALKAQGTDGIYWYLATRKVTGMDSHTLRQCALWLIQQPQAMEVHAGWITAYTGIEPRDLLRVPPSHALIVDRLSRHPQIVEFRESHTRQDTQGRDNGGYALPPLSQKSSALLMEALHTPPFPDR